MGLNSKPCRLFLIQIKEDLGAEKNLLHLHKGFALLLISEVISVHSYTQEECSLKQYHPYGDLSVNRTSHRNSSFHSQSRDEIIHALYEALSFLLDTPVVSKRYIPPVHPI